VKHPSAPSPLTARLRSRGSGSRRAGGARGSGPEAAKLVVAGAVVAAAIAVAVAVAVSRDDEAPQRRGPVSTRFAGTGLEVTAPAGWARSDEPLALPGITTAGAVVLAEELSKTQLIATLLPASSPTLVPEPLVRRLRTPLGAPRRVLLGGRLPAYYYGDLALMDLPGRTDIYAVPTSDGVATIACSGVPAPVEECAAAAERLTLTGGERRIRPGPEAAFRSRLEAEIGALDAVRERTRVELSAATTAAGQEAAARRLSAAYAAAATTLLPLAGADGSKPRAIVQRLRANAATYGQVAAGLAAGDPVAVTGARRAARDGEVALQGLLAELG
jgi:hypothetical protein